MPPSSLSLRLLTLGSSLSSTHLHCRQVLLLSSPQQTEKPSVHFCPGNQSTSYPGLLISQLDSVNSSLASPNIHFAPLHSQSAVGIKILAQQLFCSPKPFVGGSFSSIIWPLQRQTIVHICIWHLVQCPPSSLLTSSVSFFPCWFLSSSNHNPHEYEALVGAICVGICSTLEPAPCI